MTKAQRWVFILVTLPICTAILAIWISDMFPWNITLRVGNVWSSNTTRPPYSYQEKLNIWEYGY